MSGEFTDVHRYGTAIMNAKAVGQCELISRLLDIDYKDMFSEETLP